MDRTDMDRTYMEQKLKRLAVRHRELDSLIDQLYNKHASDLEIRALKVQKLRYKDQIETIKNKLGKLNET